MATSELVRPSLLPLLLLLLLPALAPTSIAAQRVPGFQGRYDEAMAEFRAEALAEFDEVLRTWIEAVREGEVDRAMELYADDPFVHLGEPVRGEEATRAFLEEWVGRVGTLEAGLFDFEASGRMSYATLNVRVHTGEASGPRTGTMVVVTYRQGGEPRIRSQVLVTEG